MNNVYTNTKYIFSLIGGVIISSLGGWDMGLRVLAGLVTVDYITGIIAAAKEKELSSEKGSWGIVKKAIIFVIVYLATLIDKAAGANVFRNITILFYTSNEGISVLENTARLGVPYPNKLMEILKQLKKDSDDI